MRWLLLLPNALGCVSIAAALGVMVYLDTNRSTPDFYLGTTGLVLLPIGVIALIAFAILFPYRAAAGTDWLTYAAFIAVVIAHVLLASTWFAMHLA